MYPSRKPDTKRIIINTHVHLNMLCIALFVTLLGIHAWKGRYITYRKQDIQVKIEECYNVLDRLASLLTFVYDPHTVCMHLGIAHGVHPFTMLVLLPKSNTLQCLLSAALIHPYLMALLALTAPITMPEAFLVATCIAYAKNKRQ